MICFMPFGLLAVAVHATNIGMGMAAGVAVLESCKTLAEDSGALSTVRYGKDLPQAIHDERAALEVRRRIADGHLQPVDEVAA